MQSINLIYDGSHGNVVVIVKDLCEFRMTYDQLRHLHKTIGDELSRVDVISKSVSQSAVDGK